MFRLALYAGGAVIAVGVLALLNDYRRSTRRIPVQDAAAQLKAAWANNHTTA
jgi:hypothetical protein